MPFTSKVLIGFAIVTCFWAVAPAQAAPTSAEQALIVEVNRVRAQHGLRDLRFDPALERSARARTRGILRTGSLTHGSIAPRIVRYGVRGRAVGENLGWGIGSRSSAQWIVATWLASPSHRANLLRRGFNRIGVGRGVGTFHGHGDAAVVTAHFAG